MEKQNICIEHCFHILMEIQMKQIWTSCYFKKPITPEEWEQLSEEYHKAWFRGNMTKELSEELERLRAKESV